jgi:putative nucleotidyltransferase with HDIG domain
MRLTTWFRVAVSWLDGHISAVGPGTWGGAAVMAVLVAVVYVEFGLVSIVFLVVPVLALRFVRGASRSLDRARDEALMAFVRATEEKDPFTYRHSERVAAICVALHQALGAKPQAVERRRIAALLHDVGKVAVPSLILTKPGDLTDEEYEVIKQHPVVGAEVARRIDIFNDLTTEILLHHERMDGTGYPYGIEGSDIPRAARVLAVADTFEALTSDRHYRPALSPEQALAEMEAACASQLDQEAVGALRKLVSSGVAFDKPDRGNVVPLGVARRAETWSATSLGR